MGQVSFPDRFFSCPLSPQIPPCLFRSNRARAHSSLIVERAAQKKSSSFLCPCGGSTVPATRKGAKKEKKMSQPRSRFLAVIFAALALSAAGPAVVDAIQVVYTFLKKK